MRKKKSRRNPSGGDKAAITKARRLARNFHGKGAGDVLKLDARERTRPPKYAVLVGELKNIVYTPLRGKRANANWDHLSGDRGSGVKAGKLKPYLAVNPKTRRPFLVMGRSGLHFSSKRGLVG